MRALYIFELQNNLHQLALPSGAMCNAEIDSLNVFSKPLQCSRYYSGSTSKNCLGK